jgi:hypothetical protein
VVEIARLLEYRFQAERPGTSPAYRSPSMMSQLDLESICRAGTRDGLGPVRGALIQLPSGRVVVVRELAHAESRLAWS